MNSIPNTNTLKLILFDVDGTLIRSAGAGRIAMNRAFEKVFGVTNGFESVPMMGRTDPIILKEVMRAHDIEWSAFAVQQFQTEYFPMLDEELKVPRPGVRICPGIESLLFSLKMMPHCYLGLLTGNWKLGAYSKLRHFKLNDYFMFGAFADDKEDRNRLVPVAIDRFKQKTGHSIDITNVFVIGDTVLDIECGRVHGAKTIAVATGIQSFDVLNRENPDYCFHNFSDLPRVLAIFQ